MWFDTKLTYVQRSLSSKPSHDVSVRKPQIALFLDFGSLGYMQSYLMLFRSKHCRKL